jgi:hypothetical protein
MPHLLIERIRSSPDALFKQLGGYLLSKFSKPDYISVYLVELLDIIAALVFLSGSICFLPAFSVDFVVFLTGCVLFIAGSAMYSVVSTFTLWEATSEKGVTSFEAGENMLYAAGSYAYLLGSILYYPGEDQYKQLEEMKDMSLVQYSNLFERELSGTILFILGSFFFAFAAFTNALNQRKFGQWSSRMLTIVTALYLGGSILFAMGSIGFLPNIGSSGTLLALAAWCFVVGSSLFLVGSTLSLWRTSHVLGVCDHERQALLKSEVPELVGVNEPPILCN